MSVIQRKHLSDELRIRIGLSGGKEIVESFSDILQILANSIFPNPTVLRLSEGIDYDIDGFLDPFILSSLQEELQKERNTLQLFFQDESNVTVLDPGGIIYSLIELEFASDGVEEKILDLTKKIITSSHTTFLTCALRKISRKIYRKHFEWEDRTVQSPNLVWLQYFGAEEFERQGGEAIFDNPYIKAERLGDGIIIQVGGSPFDAYTSKGEELLVQATNAMPPVVKTRHD